jgi:hypothetical protein
MTFSHMKVSKIVRDHQRQMEYLNNQVETTDPSSERVRANVLREVDGVPVSRALSLLCDEVRRMARGVKFAVERNGKSQWRDGIQVISEIWAYYPEDTYAFMRLGFADYSVQSGTSSKFAVYSRNIKNEKFNDQREQYHMAMADTLERAVKNAKKFMRRYGVNEVAHMSLHEFQSKLGSVMYTASSAYNESYEKVIKHGSFHNEMRSLVMNNHQFNDPAFGAAVKDMLAKLDEQMAKQYEQHHGYYVQVREYLGEQVFDVIAVLDVRRATAAKVGAHHTYKAEELSTLDENLPNKMAALSMLEDGAFVEGLGHKVNPTSYWVLK